MPPECCDNCVNPQLCSKSTCEDYIEAMKGVTSEEGGNK